MRLEILERIHEGHQGIVKCRRRVKDSVWWPGLSKQLEDMVTNCRKCIEHRKPNREPMIPSEVPERPWQVLETNLFSRYNSSHRCTELPNLKPGEHVWVVDQKTPATVSEKAETPRYTWWKRKVAVLSEGTVGTLFPSRKAPTRRREDESPPKPAESHPAASVSDSPHEKVLYT